MGYFPICMDISEQKVILVGNGSQINDKAEKLRSFCPGLVQTDTLTAEDLRIRPTFVVVGDLPYEAAQAVAALCKKQNIPVNVVDQPALCTFFFPSLITAGELTVSVSTGGKAPGAAVYLKKQIQELLPDRTDEILDWLSEIRPLVKKNCPPEQYAKIMRSLTEEAFAKGAPLDNSSYMIYNSPL